MKGFYSIDGKTYSDTDDAFQSALSYAHSKKIRPQCLCSDTPIPMYVARIDGRFLVKRMPNSGQTHNAMCPSYEPPPELSGLGKVLGSAISDDGEAGETVLKVGFSLTKRVANIEAPLSSGQSDSVKAETNKLTLRAFFDYLWDQAEFTRWSPKMEDKRNWYVIHRHLVDSAHGKKVKGQDLENVLYVPEPWERPKAEEIKRRRNASLASIAKGHKGSHAKKIVVGEYKTLEPSRFGHVLSIKHAPGWGLFMNEDVAERIRKRFAMELEMFEACEAKGDVRLLCIATFSLSPSRQAKLDEVSLILCNRHWIPVETPEELDLINELIAQKRYFCKGLRYNLLRGEPLASAVLQDTLGQETALYVVPRDADEAYREALEELQNNSGLSSWVWETDKYPNVPTLPPQLRSDGYGRSQSRVAAATARDVPQSRPQNPAAHDKTESATPEVRGSGRSTVEDEPPPAPPLPEHPYDDVPEAHSKHEQHDQSAEPAVESAR